MSNLIIQAWNLIVVLFDAFCHGAALYGPALHAIASQPASYLALVGLVVASTPFSLARLLAFEAIASITWCIVCWWFQFQNHTLLATPAALIASTLMSRALAEPYRKSVDGRLPDDDNPFIKPAFILATIAGFSYAAWLGYSAGLYEFLSAILFLAITTPFLVRFHTYIAVLVVAGVPLFFALGATLSYLMPPVIGFLGEHILAVIFWGFIILSIMDKAGTSGWSSGSSRRNYTSDAYSPPKMNDMEVNTYARAHGMSEMEARHNLRVNNRV